MYIDIGKYENSKSLAIDWFETHSKDVNNTISTFASFTSIPCIVIAMWIGEHTNWNEESTKAVVRLQDFYGYTQIDGKPKGSPV